MSRLTFKVKLKLNSIPRTPILFHVRRMGTGASHVPGMRMPRLGPSLRNALRLPRVR
jgi:hypothetical protein